jgi:hypothetical protein
MNEGQLIDHIDGRPADTQKSNQKSNGPIYRPQFPLRKVCNSNFFLNG